MPVEKIPGSVVENIKRIKGADKKINTIEEAKALLEYMPRADVHCDEDYIRLYQAYQAAQKILNGEDANLGETLVKYYNKAVEKGSQILVSAMEKFNNWRKSLASL